MVESHQGPAEELMAVTLLETQVGEGEGHAPKGSQSLEGPLRVTSPRRGTLLSRDS